MANTGRVVRPYGDTTGDGWVQLSFTLPVPMGGAGERAWAEAAALQLATKMGMDQAMVVHAKTMGPDFTFFIVYGRVSHLVDLSAINVTEREFPLLSPHEVNLRIRTVLGRKLVVVGACVGTDAHTVGIDAILNVKGHAGEKGLEYYREIRVVNLGAQVSVSELAGRARRERADAVLVSQVVTQRDAHLTGARALAEAFVQPSGATDGEGGAPGDGEDRILAAGDAPGRPLLVVGGPRFDPAMARELGVDRIFGRGTTPREVASYLMHALAGPDSRRDVDRARAAARAGTATAGSAQPGSGPSASGLSASGPSESGLTGPARRGPERWRGSVGPADTTSAAVGTRR
ncbi:MAG TPA: OAM dimerization domain-containing protein [Streptosporangiaceae bacterium]|nr:OAM dimerization domain-containing protein [Streptosporangiaceae bacterium]